MTDKVKIDLSENVVSGLEDSAAFSVNTNPAAATPQAQFGSSANGLMFSDFHALVAGFFRAQIFLNSILRETLQVAPNANEVIKQIHGGLGSGFSAKIQCVTFNLAGDTAFGFTLVNDPATDGKCLLKNASDGSAGNLELADIKATTYHVGASAGVDGTFTDKNDKVVTVTKGIITSIV